MKKQLQLLALILIAITTKATSQITIEHTDMPQIGYHVITGFDANTVFQIGEAGPDKTWNFSNAVAESFDTVSYLNPMQVPNHQLFPEADIVAYASLDESYSSVFIQVTANDMALLGTNGDITIFPGTSIVFTSFFTPAQTLQLPYNYNDNHTINYTEVSYGGSYADGQLIDSSKTISHVNTVMHIDAWGTMTIPAGTFQVLRSKQTDTSVDSLFTWIGNNWQFMSVNQFTDISYDWIAKDYGYIASLYTDGSTGTGLSYMISQTTVNTNDIKIPETQISVYPNPATDQITISAAAQPEKVDIYNINGQLQITSTNRKVIDVSDLPQGVYIIKAHNGNQVQTTKFLKK